MKAAVLKRGAEAMKEVVDNKKLSARLRARAAANLRRLLPTYNSLKEIAEQGLDEDDDLMGMEVEADFDPFLESDGTLDSPELWVALEPFFEHGEKSEVVLDTQTLYEVLTALELLLPYVTGHRLPRAARTLAELVAPLEQKRVRMAEEEDEDGVRRLMGRQHSAEVELLYPDDLPAFPAPFSFSLSRIITEA